MSNPHLVQISVIMFALFIVTLIPGVILLTKNWENNFIIKSKINFYGLFISIISLSFFITFFILFIWE